MMTLLEKNIHNFPSPCYIIEEELLRRNLTLIADVAKRADVEIILAFKAFALWKSFPIFREYISHTTASSLYEAMLAKNEFGSKAHTYSPAYTDEEFDDIVECSSHITFNSLSQYCKSTARFKNNLEMRITFMKCTQGINKKLHIIVLACHQMPAAKIDPPNLFKPF